MEPWKIPNSQSPHKQNTKAVGITSPNFRKYDNITQVTGLETDTLINGTRQRTERDKPTCLK